MVNKLDGLRDVLINYSFDILIVDDEFKIPGYTFARKDRTQSSKASGGGVMFYVRDNIPFTARPDLAADKDEALWIEILRPKCKPLLIASIYRPPEWEYNEVDFVGSIDDSLCKVNAEHYNIVSLGDFNINQLVKNNAPSRLFKLFSIKNELK